MSSFLYKNILLVKLHKIDIFEKFWQIQAWYNKIAGTFWKIDALLIWVINAYRD